MDPWGPVALGSAAGALFYILTLLVGGKLHTSSEVNGLRADKQQLLATNARLSAAVEKSNSLLEQVINLLDAPAKRRGAAG